MNEGSNNLDSMESLPPEGMSAIENNEAIENVPILEFIEKYNLGPNASWKDVVNAYRASEGKSDIDTLKKQRNLN